MATPFLRALRHHFGPSAEIFGVMRPRVREVITGSNWLDEEIWYEPRGNDPFHGIRSVIGQLHGRRVDTVYLLTNSIQAAWVAFRSQARYRIGYARNGRGPLLTHSMRPRRERGRRIPISAVDYFLNLLQYEPIEVHSQQPELYTTAQGEMKAKQVWDTFDWMREDSVVALNTGGAYGQSKHWPVGHAAELSNSIAEQGHRVLILCGPQEVETARQIEQSAQHPNVRSMANQDLSLETSKSCLRRCRLMISTDSGPRHMAAAFDVPTITLFGSMDPRWSQNYAARNISISADLPCSPCGKRTCPLGHQRCMTEITPARVGRAVRAMLQDERLVKERSRDLD